MTNITVLCKNKKFSFKKDDSPYEDYDIIDFDDFYVKLLDDIKPTLGIEDDLNFTNISSSIEKKYCRFVLEQTGTIHKNFKIILTFNFIENKNTIEVVKNYVNTCMSISIYFDDNQRLLSLYNEFTNDLKYINLSFLED